MIQVSINRTCARLQSAEPLTSGMIGKQMQLVFDSSWDDLRKTAVFFDGKNAVSLMDSFWGDNNTITIPHEVLTEAGATVTMGVYGYTVQDDETILAIPSIYTELGKVKKGADPEADPTADPTLPVYAQLEWKIDHFEVPEEQIATQVQDYLAEHPIEIQPATETVLGGVKVGNGLSVTADGTLSADVTADDLDDLADTVDGKADAADIPTKTSELTNDSGFLTQHQSLAGYATESYVQNYHDNTKQDVIADLATIRSGAALGATALQSVPSTYRTASAQDVIDSGKLSDAPSDGKQYARRNGVWAEVQSGGGGGTSDHSQLTNRDAANQHPISAITGLQSTLDAKGTYSKPSGGIPKTDLASAVQTSLGLADSAVQPEAGKGLFSGNYNDLTNKPTIPTVNDAVLTIKQGGVTKGTFSANSATATEINLDAGGGASGIFTVNITGVGGTYSSDKTTAEILAAKNIGQLPVLYEGGVKYDLQIVDSSHAYFDRYEYDEGYLTYSSFNITSQGAVSHFSEIRSLITSAERTTWNAKQPKTITDTAGYYTSDTVEGALAEIGAKLAAYPSDVWEGGSYGS